MLSFHARSVLQILKYQVLDPVTVILIAYVTQSFLILRTIDVDLVSVVMSATLI